MAKPDYERTQQKVQEVLDDNYVSKPPVRIDEVAKNYGLHISEVDLSEFPGIAGFLDVETKTIYINARDSENRKAFTIAHELGHWLLHQQEMKNNEDYAIMYRKPLGEVNKDPIEKEANCFAAKLLVPKSILDHYKGNDIEFQARVFGVSPEVIGYRLKLEYGIASA